MKRGVWAVPAVKAGVLAAFGVLVAALAAGAFASSEAQARGSETAVVASVYDGDTLTLTNGRRVRLVQIDTPGARLRGVLLAGGADGAGQARASGRAGCARE